MAAEGKRRKARAARDEATPVVERLKPDEAAAVLGRLLEARPELVSEAEEIARSLLRQWQYEDVAAALEDEVRALDYGRKTFADCAVTEVPHPG